MYPSPTTINITKGLQEPLRYVNIVTEGLFMRLFLTTVFIVATFSIFYKNKDFLASVTTGGFITSVIAILLKIAGLIGLIDMIVPIVLTCICFIWLIITRR